MMVWEQGTFQAEGLVCSKALRPVKSLEELHHIRRPSWVVSGEGRVRKVALESILGLAWPLDTDAGHVIALFLSLKSQSQYFFFMLLPLTASPLPSILHCVMVRETGILPSPSQMTSCQLEKSILSLLLS